MGIEQWVRRIVAGNYIFCKGVIRDPVWMVESDIFDFFQCMNFQISIDFED